MHSVLENKHQQKTEVTKRKLVKAARRIFARDGFEAARINDIAVEAGYTRGAFYAHFKTKEDLFFALLEAQSSVKVETLRSALKNCVTERQKLDCVREFYATRIEDRQWAILILEFKLYALRHSKSRAKLAAAHRSIRAKLKFEDVERLLPSELQRNAETHSLRRRTLEVILTALVLENAYDPTGMPEGEAIAVLRQLFDAVTHP
ncbi:MAG: TetR/AcrR family transcriptional regulator [Acidobacteriota bacterium]|nr:TetR/AcrR family transcriptional regulator [Acidobacteriota bacterium]